MNEDLAERVARLERENRLIKLVGSSAVVTRVTRLEKENRFIKLAGACALVAALIFLLLGRGPQKEYLDVIKARSFQVVDENLEIRAELSLWPKHGLERLEDLRKELEDPIVDQIPGHKESILKTIEELEEDPALFGLRIHSPGGSASLVGTVHGAPRLVLSGDGGFGGLSPRGLRLSAKDKGRISLAVHDWPTLTMFRSEDTAGIWVFVTEESSSISIQDGSFQDRARLEVPHPTTDETGEETEALPPSLIFFDKEGDVIWETP